MNKKEKEQIALILIDIQKAFEDIEYWGNRNNPYAEQNAGKLLEHWRKMNWPLFHVKHCSSNPDSRLAEGKPGNEFQDVVKPLAEETVIKKNVNSAFIGTNLEEKLRGMGIQKVVIAGLTTDQCVSTSVRMAGNLGFDTIVVNDATATFDKIGFDGKKYDAQIIHETALASVNQEFATVMNSEDLLTLVNQNC